MSTLYKEYVELSENGKWKCKEKQLRMSISFYRGSNSSITGYRVCVVPIAVSERGNGIVMEEYGAYTGFNDWLLPAERQSAKKLQQAIAILQERKDKYTQYFIESTETIES